MKIYYSTANCTSLVKPRKRIELRRKLQELITNTLQYFHRPPNHKTDIQVLNLQIS